MLLTLYKNEKEDLKIGLLEFFINSDNEEEVYITDLFIEEKFRGRKYGTKLLLHLYDYLSKHTKVKNVLWMDCSDRCFRPDNLYVKLGATYRKYAEEPDMCWNLYDRYVRLCRRNYLKEIYIPEEIYIIESYPNNPTNNPTNNK